MIAIHKKSLMSLRQDFDEFELKFLNSKLRKFMNFFPHYDNFDQPSWLKTRLLWKFFLKP